MITVKNNCNGTLPPGFYSNFLIVLDWVHNSIYTKEKIIVKWNCDGREQENLWEIFFDQPNIITNENNRNLSINHYRFMNKNLIFNDIDKILPLYKKYDGNLWNRFDLFYESDFKNLRNEYNKAWNLIKIKDTITKEIKNYEKDFKGKILGATVRIPLHYTFDKPEGIPLSNKIKPEEYYELIAEEIIEEYNKNKYDKIFICCDVKFFIDLMLEKLGDDKLIYTSYNRVTNLNGDWNEKKLSFKDEYKLIIIDSLLLSKCDYIMGGSSNIFLGTLFINNNVDFKIFNVLKNLYGC